MEDFKQEYFDLILSKSGQLHAKNTLSVLDSATKFEEEFGIPLYQFDHEQMRTFFSSWGRNWSNTFEKKKMIVFWYLEWLRDTKGIECDPVVTGVKFSEASDPDRATFFFESTSQIAAAFRVLFFDLYNEVPRNLRMGLATMLKTIGLGNDEIAILKRSDIDFENRVINAVKRYEDVEPSILSLIKQGMEYDCFYDGNQFQHLMRSELVIRPIRRKMTKLTETSVRGMIQRTTKCAAKTRFHMKSFTPSDLTHSYIFSKLYEYECSTGIRVTRELTVAATEPYWSEIERWTNLKLNSYRSRVALVKEYLNWKEYYNKRV